MTSVSTPCLPTVTKEEAPAAGGPAKRLASDVAVTRRRRSILGLADLGETADTRVANTVGLDFNSASPYPSGMPGSPCPNRLDRRAAQLALARRQSLPSDDRKAAACAASALADREPHRRHSNCVL